MARQPQTHSSGPASLSTRLIIYPAIATGLLLLGLVSCMALLYLQVIGASNTRHHEAQAAQSAAGYASFLEGQAASLRLGLTRYASSERVRSVMASGDTAAAASLARELREVIPHARRVDFIAPGNAAVDLTATTPISFAALDAIRRAEKTAFVGPESSANPPDLLFAAARIQTQAGKSLGVMFVALSNEYFLLPLRQFDPSMGHLQVQQVFAKTPPTIALRYGAGSPSVDALRVPLQIPQWSVLFTPNPALPDLTSPLSALLPLAVGFGLALAGIALAFSRLFGNMRADAKTLSDYAGKLLRGRSPNLDTYRLRSFQHLAGRLANAASSAADITATATFGTPAARHGAAAIGARTAEPSPRAPRAARPIEQAPAAAELPTPAQAATDLAAAAAAEPAAPLADDDDFLDLGDDLDQDLDDDRSADDMQGDNNFGIGVSEGASPIDLGLELDPEIFRAYDIRGIVEENLGTDVVYWIGRAFASEARASGNNRTIVGRDGRLSSPALAEALCRGLIEGGIDTLDIGQVTTPMLYFATHSQNTGTGIMITGSHNPPQYNGLKLMIGGTTLAEDAIQRLQQRIVTNDLDDGVAEGELKTMGIDTAYLDRILEDVAIAQSLKVVVDCGNGVAGGIAPKLLQELGCEVVPLYCDVDGTFPNHHPDPADPANLEDLITVVQAEGADIGLAFDGDGDRLGVVTGSGAIIWPDKLMMLFARDIVGRNPGADIVYDVKCSRHLNNVISEYGGRPIMWKTGHSHMKAKIRETGALLGGEFSGHIAFAERWYGFDDALYAAARLLEIVGAQTASVDELFAEFPTTVATPEIKVATTERAKFEIIETLRERADFGDGTLTDIDGLRIDYVDGWGLIRPSNTGPVLTLRFEADDESALARVQQIFRQQLAKVDGSLSF